MIRYKGPQTALTIDLPGGLYLTIMMDHPRGPQSAFIIALPGVLYLAIIMHRYRGPKLPLP
jgi:hypothetical protein